ncbi:MAG: uncharacterized protein JWO98_3084 [Frankiales bacterium]|nr:uncharacterized protein [Frankiales bacterium]
MSLSLLGRRAAVAILATVVAVLAFGVGPASAHVTVSSPDATPGGFAQVTFQVPSESDTANTTSIAVKLPTDTPFGSVSVKPVPGWTATATKKTLATPIKTDDGTVTEAVSTVTWTANNGGLTPGQYQEFSLSVGPLPNKSSTLTFPSLQGYSDGTTVSWIDPTIEGQPEPQHPAPTLKIAAASGSASASTTSAPSRSGTSGLAVTALIVGIVGLLAGIAGVALALSARRRSAPSKSSVSEQEPENASV